MDLDPQAYPTYGLGIQAHELADMVYEVFKSEIAASEVIVERGKLEILLASLSLSAADGGPQGAVLSSLARQSSLPSGGRLAPRARRQARDCALFSERL